MSQEPFKKFINQKKNAAIKEKHKQEKKLSKKQRAAAIEMRFMEKRLSRTRAFSGNNPKESEQVAQKERRQKYPQVKKDASVVDQKSQVKNNSTPVMPLNKYLAHCGVTSRRDAVNLIIKGKDQ